MTCINFTGKGICVGFTSFYTQETLVGAALAMALCHVCAHSCDKWKWKEGRLQEVQAKKVNGKWKECNAIVSRNSKQK